MNSNLSLTDDLWQSTLRLFSGTRFPSSVPGFPVPARAAARAHSRLAAVPPPHAHRGGGFPPYPGGPPFYTAPSPPRGAWAAAPRPSFRLHPLISPGNASFLLSNTLPLL